MSADPRPPLRWVPILLGLLVASLLIVMQLTRASSDAEPIPSETAAPS